jgi:hypothetical protein
MAPSTPPSRSPIVGVHDKSPASKAQTPQQALATLLKLEEDFAVAKKHIHSVNKKVEETRRMNKAQLAALADRDSELKYR